MAAKGLIRHSRPCEGVKNGYRENAGQVKKDLTGKAEEIKKNTLKDVGGLRYLNQQEKESSNERQKTKRDKHEDD